MNILKRRMIIMLAVAVSSLVIMGIPSMAKDFKVAGVLPGTITDHGPNQLFYEGLMKAKDVLNVEVAFSEKVAQADHSETMSDYARRGYDMVIAMGGEFTDSGKRLAERYPETIVSVFIGKPTEGLNTVNYDYKAFGYVLGFVAGKMTKTGKAALITGQPVSSYNELLEGYRKGFERGHPGGNVFSVATNDWDDVAKAKEAALSLISKGADVLLPYLDYGALGVLGAAEEKHVYAMGVFIDLAQKWPQINLLSVVMDNSEAVLFMVELAKNGQLEKRDYRLGFGTKAGKLGEFNPAIPADVKTEVQKIVEDLISGIVKF